MGVFRYVRLDWRQVLALLVLTLLGAAAEMGLPTLLAHMIDDGVAAGAQGVIVGVALAMVALALVGCVASLVSTVLSAHISTSLAASLRRQLFVKVQGVLLGRHGPLRHGQPGDALHLRRLERADVHHHAYADGHDGAAHAGGGHRPVCPAGWGVSCLTDFVQSNSFHPPGLGEFRRV